MKHELIRIFRSKQNSMSPSFKKKLIIAVAAFSVFVFIGLGLLGYFTYKAGSFLLTQTTQITTQLAQNQKVDQILQNTTAQTEKIIRSFSLQSCLLQIDTVLNLNNWLQKPIAQTVNTIIHGCLPAQAAAAPSVTDTPKTDEKSKDDQETYY